MEVRLDAGDGKGKGIFATRRLLEGDTLFKEAPLVRALWGRLLTMPRLPVLQPGDGTAQLLA